MAASAEKDLSFIERLGGSPMAPITNGRIPAASEWAYQLKWDGVRILADISASGNVQLYSRKLLPKNDVYPEVLRALSGHAAYLSECVLDGEVIYWDGAKPSFQKVLQRERSGVNASSSSLPYGEPSNIQTGLDLEKQTEAETDAEHVLLSEHVSLNEVGKAEPDYRSVQGRIFYVLFDLLYENGHDLRSLPFSERHDRLQAKIAPIGGRELLTTAVYTDGEALWDWVRSMRWEGIVSKRLSSPYKPDKKHDDWLKKKTALVLDVGIVGVKRRDGRAASFVMANEDGRYFGSVSLGLTEAMRDAIGTMLRFGEPDAIPLWPMPFDMLPADLKGEEIVWLPAPMACRVTGLEITSAGLLRHPKLVSFGSPSTQNTEKGSSAPRTAGRPR
ncbi:DNA ligase [Paenibacillus sp. NPDC058071]|uniref:ATP-dependent DNA ligase n=1 Tax=Paenibacillus sp. NPDC058071 TaxID=3346326 RepID=UPI0036DDD9B6